MANVFDELSAKDYLTLANAASGFIAIISALLAFSFAPFFFLIAAMFFDFVDGAVARKSGKSNAIGKQLDSLSDAISFGAFPAVLVSVFYFSSPFAVLCSVVYLCAGIIRLARYNLQSEKGVYFGLPIPAAAFLSVSAFYLNQFFAPSIELAPVALLLCAAFMVSSFKIRKPGLS